ncbi:hemagglutinin repeat-containing protein, partial [Aestuariispira insulae]|uniref:hemagglutinin repeat-containing protein n=1 Tax=Aestuariispira insulae TaxID=1461337 RepID=UPI0015F273B3
EGEGGAAAQGVTAASAVLKAASAVTALQKGAVSAEVSFGVSSSEESSSLETETARVAEIHAGRDVNLTAGDDITAEGTRILGGRDVNLEAGDELTLESAQDHFASSSQSSSKSASVGASVGVGFTGYTASASGSVSSSDSDREETRTTQSNAQVAAGRDVTIKTGGDTTLKGARVAAGEDISAEIGGDLLVESVQDTGRIDGSSSGSSVGLGIGLGGSDFGSDGGGAQTAEAGGDEPSLMDRTSLNSSSSMGRESGEKAWVNQQTGLVAGGDVEINVGGHTQVNGGIIASTGGDVTLSTETFAHRHLRDVDNYEQKNISISGSTNLGSLFGGDDNGGGTGGTGGNAGNGASGADG